MKKTQSKDTSPKVYNPNKVDFELDIHEMPWTPKQQEFIRIGLDKKTRVVICKSPPGTGKSMLSLYCALIKLKEKKSSKLLYLRCPVESASKGIGFVKGDLSEKMANWLLPATDNLKQLLTESQLNRLLNEGFIEAIPIGYIKGRSLSVSTIIADEAEDLSVEEFRLCMSRQGAFSTMFLIGDVKQANIKDSGFDKIYHLFNNPESKEKGIHCFEFGKEDIMRNEVLSFILDKFDELENLAKPEKAKPKQINPPIEDYWSPSRPN